MGKKVLGLIGFLLIVSMGLFFSCQEKKEATPLSQEQVEESKQAELRAAEDEFDRIFLLIADDMDEEGLNLLEEIAKSNLSMDVKQSLMTLHLNLKELSLKDQSLRAAGNEGGDYTDYLTDEQKRQRKREILEASKQALVDIFINMDPGGAVDRATKRLQEIHDKYEKMAQDNGYQK